jgi:deferrochelatase/peroxidase EfeB
MRRGKGPFASRRKFLLSTGGLAAATGIGFAAPGGRPSRADIGAPAARPNEEMIEVLGAHQAGIATPQQQHTYFAAFDLTTHKRDEVVAVLKAWTEAAQHLARGEPTQTVGTDDAAAADDYGMVQAPADDAEPAKPPPASDKGAGDKYAADDYGKDASAASVDSGEVLGMAPARLTLTFGFGAGLFIKDGKDRYGLAMRRPAALVDLPMFHGDQLQPTRTDGDLSVQACADDPQVAFHAVRQMARLADKFAQIRWAQAGFLAGGPAGETPRNLMGFKDGTQQPTELDKFVWVGDEGPSWMRDGSYLVVRRIRIALEHWDRMKVGFQERTVGRHKLSGAPLGKGKERDALDLQATDSDGNPVMPENAHVRLATAATNDGAQILRRGYSYNDGVDFTAERWPPWRQGMEYDAGLFFVAYQRDPRAGFVKIFERMARFDMLNQFVTHTGGGLFACPGGIRDGEYVGQRLFEEQA